MSKLAKQPQDTTWEGTWAQSVAQSLRQLSARDADPALDESDPQFALLDEQLTEQVLEGLNRPQATFHEALGKLARELTSHGLEAEYDRFSSCLNEAAQTQQWERGTSTTQGVNQQAGRTSLFGLGLLVVTSHLQTKQSWSAATNRKLVQLLVKHRQVSPRGRVVLLPLALNTQESVDLEPWVGYRMTTLLSQWAEQHPNGHPSVAQARQMLQAAGVELQMDLRVPSTSSTARAKCLRHLTLLGLHIPEPEPALEDVTADPQDALDYDFPHANFTTEIRTAQKELERVLLALSMRQGRSTLGVPQAQADELVKPFESWSMARLQAEATALSASLDGIRAAHPSLAETHGLDRFGEGELSQALSAVLLKEMAPGDSDFVLQPAWPATFVFEATDEGLKAYRDLTFRAQASLAASNAGLAQASGMLASVDHDVDQREFQVMFLPVSQMYGVGFAPWVVLPWEPVEGALNALRDTLALLGVDTVRTVKPAGGRLH